MQLKHVACTYLTPKYFSSFLSFLIWENGLEVGTKGRRCSYALVAVFELAERGGALLSQRYLNQLAQSLIWDRLPRIRTTLQ
jgi:hypothetical protein